MPSFQIGHTKIPYDLRRSASVGERRITVTPNHVEVVALASDSDDDVASFLNRKRQWLFNTVREIEHIAAERHAVPRFLTGSKIPYRGRNMSLTVRRTDAEGARVTYRNGFIVDLPYWAGDPADVLVASELRHWLKQRVRRDVAKIAAEYAARFGLVPRSIRVSNLVNGWGSCGQDGNVLIHWHLIFAPSKVLDYVVAHELCHLRHRSHGAEFWAFLKGVAPQFEAAKSWLDRHQGRLSSEFLDCAAASL